MTGDAPRPSQVVVAPTPSEPVMALGMPGQATSGRAAILLVMEPGNKGIRRFEKTADPILCVRDGCYVSEGNGQPARFMSGHRALGVGNTWGARAGACQHSLGCVYRDVDLAASGGYVQPVDMKVMVHDRRESQIVSMDSDCRIDAAALTCRRPVIGNGYRLWVVPEALAARVGVDQLDAAVRAGLPTRERAGNVR